MADVKIWNDRYISSGTDRGNLVSVRWNSKTVHREGDGDGDRKKK